LKKGDKMKSTDLLEILNVLNKYKQTDMKIIKENLKNACKNLYEKHEGRKGISSLIGMELNAFQSCLNPSHSSNITFENLIKFCGILDIDIDDMLKPTNIIKSNRGVIKTWTNERQQELIERFDNGGIAEVKKRFNLTDKTILHYYNLFKKEQNG
jgi:DNA-binding Xre family transcriptional regulator